MIALNPALALPLWIGINAILWGLATLFCRPLATGSRPLDLAVRWFGWIFLTALTVLGFGLVGALSPWPIAIAAVVGAAGLFVFRRRLTPVPSPPAPTPSRFQRGLATAALVLFAIQAVRMGVHVWLLPPYVGDTLCYHLPNTAEWIRAERIVTFDTPVNRTFWPANFALLQTWCALFPRHDFLIDVAGVVPYVLALLSVYSIARSLHLRHGAAILTAAVFGYTPAVAMHATSGNNDIAIAAVFLLIVAVLVDWRRRGGATPQRLCILWMAFAFAMGTKPYIAFVSPGLAVIGWWCWRRARRLPSAANPVPPTTWVVAGLGGVLLAGYWFVRNWIEFDNPFYPTDFKLFGEVIFGSGTGKSQQGTFSLAGMGENLRQLLTRKIFDSHWPFHADLAHMTGWGWFTFACGFPAIVVAAVLRRDARWLVAGFLVSLVVLLGFVTPDDWNMRFSLWFPAVAALCFGIVITGLRAPPARVGLIAVAVVCVALNFVGSLGIGRMPPRDFGKLWDQPVWERSAASFGHYTGPGFQAVLDRIPPEEPLGYYTRGDGYVYPLYGPEFERDIRYVPMNEEGGIAAAMAARGVRHLFVYKPLPAAERRITAAVEAGELINLGEDRTARGQIQAGLYATSR